MAQRRPQVAIHVSPELWKHAIVNVLDAADFPDWLFTEQERCIGGIPFRLAEVHSNDCNTPVASLHQSFRTVMILIILGIQSRTRSNIPLADLAVTINQLSNVDYLLVDLLCLWIDLSLKYGHYHSRHSNFGLTFQEMLLMFGAVATKKHQIPPRSSSVVMQSLFLILVSMVVGSPRGFGIR